jgi:hypothetical protein
MDALESIDVAKIVARVDDEVGLQFGERANPVLLGDLPGRHVGIRELQDGQWLRARLEHGEVLAPQGEAISLDHASPRERGDTYSCCRAQRGSSVTSGPSAGYGHGAN